MIARIDLGSRLWRLLHRRLWILAAALAAVTAYSLVSAIHDTDHRVTAASPDATATAEHIEALAGARLEVEARETFDPVTPWSTPRALSGAAAVEALARGQRDAERCGCREVLPASEFFHLSLATDSLASTTTSDETGQTL